MSSNATSVSDPYRVRPGDTLSDIAARCGTSVAELQRINGLRDPHRLEVGQTLYLTQQEAFGFSVLFLDALRAPIANLPYRLQFDGRTVEGTTGSTGLAPRHQTAQAASTISVEIRRPDGGWQRVLDTVSGYGHKLVTLVSSAIAFKGQTEPVLADVRPHLRDPLPRTIESAPSAPALGAPPQPKPVGSPSKNDPALVRVRKMQSNKGQPVIQVGIELPVELIEMFGLYSEDPITEVDWEKYADFIKCEQEVLKAIAEVETKAHAFWRLNQGEGHAVPAILYERHIFSECTKGRFDKYPDLSWPTGYRKRSELGAADPKMSDGRVDENDIYSDFASSYLRLVRAYALDSAGALKRLLLGKIPDSRRELYAMRTEESGRYGIEDVLLRKIATGHAGELHRKQTGGMDQPQEPKTWQTPQPVAGGTRQELADDRIQLQRIVV